MTDRFDGQIYHGDAAHMDALPDESIDALVTDPPAGIGFMGRDWDQPAGAAAPQTRDREHDSFPAYRARGPVTDRRAFIDSLLPIFTECYRVMKPGAHGVVWALPRTSHWTATALEDAGFEIRDVIMHLFSSGFPKSMNVARAIDKFVGVEGSFGAPKSAAHAAIIERGTFRGDDGQAGWQRPWMDDPEAVEQYGRRYVPGSPEAQRFDGWGTALKPAAEHWIMIRKPLGVRTVAGNVMAHGTGGINIDASRIPFESAADAGSAVPGGQATSKPTTIGMAAEPDAGRDVERVAFVAADNSDGRWPANVVISHNLDCECVGTRLVAGDQRDGGEGERDGGFYNVGAELGNGKPAGPLYPAEEIPIYRCTPGCAVAALDQQSGQLKSGQAATVRKTGTGYDGGNAFGAHFREEGTPCVGYGDVGGASRFFYVPKPARSEKDANLPHGMTNDHPTVKSTDLMSYLIRLVTPPGGIMLDCFAGSGSTLVAAESIGVRWVGYERDEHYCTIANARLRQRSLFG